MTLRIRVHVTLCWLALFLARIAENAVVQTWPERRREFSCIHIGIFADPAGAFRQCTELTKPQRDILWALEIDGPPPHLPAETPRGGMSPTAPAA